KMLAKNSVKLNLTEFAQQWIVDQGYDPMFGARPVKRVLQREVLNPLAKQLLAGSINKEQEIIVDFFGEGLIFRN
ncbi:MAG: hypothetical protein ACRCY6_06095, partial [Bacteroidales bacterium]